ncbi:hypothetical protein [Halorarum salinum]|uniref:hypothetical protein n=1 Tax=Halorarum salinum TaxID=2743089 RepID=UPI001FEA4DA3|nr:hypothetical protein [Halobaculum salinum]
MSLVASLPGRPLSDAEIASLNRADSVELAVAVDESGATEALLLATDDWVKGLRFLGGAWEVTETVAVDEGTDRYDALRACEDAVRAAGEGADGASRGDDTGDVDDAERDGADAAQGPDGDG